VTEPDGPTDPGAMGPDEAELLAAFDRLRPQGSVRWAFDDAVRRVDRPDLDSSAGALPWRGLPDDLWERGRSAQVGKRFVGDVARVMADILAADARAVADVAVDAVNGDRFVATWDALQYLSARVEALESRVDPLGLEVAEWPGPPPDQRAWADAVGGWFTGAALSGGPVVVGESGDGTLAMALHAAGRAVRAVDPRGAEVWRAFHDEPGPDGTAVEVVLDRADLAGKVALLGDAIRVTASGGAVAVLTTDQQAWEASLPAPARDLARGRPFHPETWSLLLARLGAVAPEWQRAPSGTVEAVVARVER